MYPLQMNGRVECVHLLLRHGARHDMASAAGHSVLHVAAANRHCSVVERLVEAGACTDAQNAHGNTPLHSAAATGTVDVMLVSLGGKAFSYLSWLGSAWRGVYMYPAYNICMAVCVRATPPLTSTRFYFCWVYIIMVVYGRALLVDWENLNWVLPPECLALKSSVLCTCGNARCRVS